MAHIITIVDTLYDKAMAPFQLPKEGPTEGLIPEQFSQDPDVTILESSLGIMCALFPALYDGFVLAPHGLDEPPKEVKRAWNQKEKRKNKKNAPATSGPISRQMTVTHRDARKDDRLGQGLFYCC